MNLFQRKQNHNEPLAYDFVAAIPVIEIRDFYTTFKKQLLPDYNVKEDTISHEQICSSFTAKQCHFFKSFLGSVPPKFICNIQKTEKPEQTASASFSFPLWHRLFLYTTLVIIACLVLIPAWIIKNYIFSGFYGHGRIGIYECAVFFMFLAGILLWLAFAFIYAGILPNYKKWMQNAVTTSSQKCVQFEKTIYHDWHKRQLRSVIFKHIYVILVLIICLCGYIFLDNTALDNIWIGFNFQNCYIIFLLLSLSFWLIRISAKSESSQYSARKMQALSINIFFGLSLAAALSLPVVSNTFFNLSESKTKATYTLAWKMRMEAEKIGIPPDNNPYIKVANEYVARVKNTSFIAIIIQISILTAVSIFVFSSRTGYKALSGFVNSIHYKGVKDVLPAKQYKGDIKRQLFYKKHELPMRDKYILMAIMFLASFCCWAGVFYSCSVLASLIFPHNEWLTSKLGEMTTETYFIAAHVWQGLLDIGPWTYFLRVLLLIPMIIPFLLFISAVLAASFISNKRFHSVVEIDNQLASKIEGIANEMGLKNISCVIISKAGKVCKADVRGIVPHNYLFFSEPVIKFIEKNPRYIEPIVAHEIAHLKLHCRQLRWLRIISRASLLGSGAMGVFINSIKIEDQADRLAVIYLKKKKLNPKLLGEAIESVHREFRKKPEQVAISSNMSSLDSPSQNNPEEQRTAIPNAGLINRLQYLIQLIFEVFFLLDCYDYIHLEPSIRQFRMQNILRYR